MDNLKLLFPTPVLQLKDVEYAKQMLPLAKKYLSNDQLVGYRWGYKNTFNNKNGEVFGLEHFEEMYDFANYICNIGQDFLYKIGYEPFTLRPFIFVSEMVRGDSHGIHTHPDCCLSGVFYLQVPTNPSKIVFHDPRQFRKYRKFTQRKDINPQTNISNEAAGLIPQVGTLLMWESWVDHEVTISESDESRITLVFNLHRKKI